jgi:hypothetical protein
MQSSATPSPMVYDHNGFGLKTGVAVLPMGESSSSST